jgi:hypothetical protein
MIGKMNRMFVIQLTGGLFRRGARHCARRVAVTDEDARAYYLPNDALRPRRVPASMLDEATMESLPILQHHDLRALQPA